jgi:uncharacterized phiE125 gp8 family phage protein
MTAALITGPALEPVSLDDAKAHLRLDTDDDDVLVGAAICAAICAARFHVEAATRRVFIEQGWRIYLDAWPRSRIVTIPVAPLIAVDAVTIYDVAGAPALVDEDDYQVDVASVPGRVVLSRTALQTVGRAVNGIEIDVTAGYGVSSVDVPSPIRQAIMMLVAHWFEYRSAVSQDLALASVPFGVEALIAPFRVLSL